MSTPTTRDPKTEDTIVQIRRREPGAEWMDYGRGTWKDATLAGPTLLSVYDVRLVDWITREVLSP